MNKVQIGLGILFLSFIAFKVVTINKRYKKQFNNLPQHEYNYFKHCKMVDCRNEGKVVKLLDGYTYKCPRIGTYKVCLEGKQHWELIR